MADKKDRVQQHASIAQELQDLVLETFRMKLRDGALTSTDLKTLVDLLRANGWSFDPTLLPQELKDKITKRVSFDEDLGYDPRIEH